METHTLLLLNGGRGLRARTEGPKQFTKINGIPLLVYALIAADAEPRIGEIILNHPPSHRALTEEVLRDWAIATPVTLLEAGRTRHESVRKLVERASGKYVLVHEAARPMVTAEDFATLIDSGYDDVSFVLPLAFTVAPVDASQGKITGYIERDGLRNVQLPQRYLRQDLVDAHRWAAERGLDYTEDATLVTAFGRDVHFIEGKEANLKVTTPFDMRMAAMLLSAKITDE
jgi:2-C-methyl-D-erythritol 4-phosphate cytidylyltransferase